MFACAALVVAREENAPFVEEQNLDAAHLLVVPSRLLANFV
jgi:hypothetical protein